MYNICLFAGTIEGHRLTEFLANQKINATVCVATEYGKELLIDAENIEILAGRKSFEEIISLFECKKFDLVIDATHPYAKEVTKNISKACDCTNTKYLRLLRDQSIHHDDVFYVSNIEEAINFLNTTIGNILVTTGSKELSKFENLIDYNNRIFCRILPIEDSLAECRKINLSPSNIIAMQGPFSEELNLAMLSQIKASWIVTKDGGVQGGFEEKLSAARKYGAKAIVIGRPKQLEGFSFDEIIQILCEKYDCKKPKRNVFILGIGPGNKDIFTNQMIDAIEKSDCIIGAKRMVEAVDSSEKPKFYSVKPDEISNYINMHDKYMNIVILMSGDTGFFSGTKRLLDKLKDFNVKIYPGISSLSYFCSQLKTSYEDIFIASMHGRQRDIVSDVRANRRVFVLTGGIDGVNDILYKLKDAGLGEVKVSIGENLSYTDEKITIDTVEKLCGKNFSSLSVMLFENEMPNAIVTHGMRDEMFQRNEIGNKIIPMTKSEIRAVCLSKLELGEYSICYDIGAGTGSVSVEMARQAKKGKVYAIEVREDACELIDKNRNKFLLKNLEIVKGKAPDVLENLEIPTHVFIGGSSGNLKDILINVLEKNPNVRIIAQAISLETISELSAFMKEFEFEDVDVTQIMASKNRLIGNYNLMTSQNPIYIFAMQRKFAKEN